MERKRGTLAFMTDGVTMVGTFTDHLGNAEVILVGSSLDDCSNALGKLVLLMQRRNGILNFNPDGSVVAGCTVDPKQIAAVVAGDHGAGW